LRAIVERATNLLQGQGGALYKIDAAKQTLSVLVSYRLGDLTRRRCALATVCLAAWRAAPTMIINDYSNWEGHVTVDGKVPFMA